MKDAKLKSALADYVQANPILSSLSGAAVATVFIYPLLILLTGLFHVSGLSQLNSLAMYLFWGASFCSMREITACFSPSAWAYRL